MDLQTSIGARKSALEPSRPEEFAVLISGLLDFAAAFGKVRFADQGQKTAAIREYREALGDLPADLLAQAVKATKAAWIYPGLPTPAEVRGHVTAALTARSVDLRRLELAYSRAPEAQPQRQPMTTEQRARLDAAMSSLRAVPGSDTAEDGAVPLRSTAKDRIASQLANIRKQGRAA